MKDDWAICRGRYHQVRERDLIAGVCVDCRANQIDSKAPELSVVSAWGSRAPKGETKASTNHNGSAKSRVKQDR